MNVRTRACCQRDQDDEAPLASSWLLDVPNRPPSYIGRGVSRATRPGARPKTLAESCETDEGRAAEVQLEFLMSSSRQCLKLCPTVGVAKTTTITKGNCGERRTNEISHVGLQEANNVSTIECGERDWRHESFQTQQMETRTQYRLEAISVKCSPVGPLAQIVLGTRPIDLGNERARQVFW